MSAAPAAAGTSAPARPRTAITFLMSLPPANRGLADDDEPATLGPLGGIDGEHVDPAHDVLAVPRDQVPARLPVVGVVLLRVVPGEGLPARARDRSADGFVDRVPRAELGHQVPRDGEDLDGQLARRHPEELDVGTGRIAVIG